MGWGLKFLPKTLSLIVILRKGQGRVFPGPRTAMGRRGKPKARQETEGTAAMAPGPGPIQV